MIPLISSMCTGPLGVRQLPRTWWKVLLRSVELLDPAYPDCSRELDDWCLRALELDKESTLSYICAEKPTYLQFEAWVLAESSLNPARIARWNEGVEKRVHVNPGKIDETYADIGFDMQEVRITSAVVLNGMQDWALFHKNDLISPTSDLRFPISPLISSLDTGPLGVYQLPRTWLKVLLKTKGVLHPDYPDCGGTGGLDTDVITVLGLDKEKTLQYLRTELPSYFQFENWVRKQTGNQFDREKIDTWHHFLKNRIHPDKKRADIHATIGRIDDGAIVHGVMLNHLEDWAYAHRALMQYTG